MSDSAVQPDELRAAVREFLDTELGLDGLRRTLASEHGAEALWSRVADLGWLALGIGAPHGGLGLGLVELGVLCEELGRALLPLPVPSTLLAAEALGLAGTPTQQAAWLPQLASGACRATLALPGAGLAQLDSSGALRGRVPHVVDADRVDLLIVSLRDHAGEVRLALLRRDAAGVRLEPRQAVDLTRSLADVVLDGARITDDELLPLDAAAWSALIDRAAVLAACDAVGGATRILERTVAYLSARVQFDRPIGSFQALKHRAATWKIQVEAMTALTRHAAALVATGAPGAASAASGAKAMAADAYVAVAGDAVQMHGGIGFTWDHECHLFLKRAHLDAVLHGHSRQHRERLARLEFGPYFHSHREHEFLLAPAT